MNQPYRMPFGFGTTQMSANNTPKDPTDQRYHRRSIRFQGYDYSQAGSYYITICTQDRDCLFGNVMNGQMLLNEAGRIVESVWSDLPRYHEGLELDAFVIMPNHVHGIIITAATVGAIRESPRQMTIPREYCGSTTHVAVKGGRSVQNGFGKTD